MLSADKRINEIIRDASSSIQTPYYLIDESRLVKNMEKIAQLRTLSGAKAVLALKCFSTWSVFDVMRPFLDGTTSSSTYEARLGAEKFGKEVHAYSVAFSEQEVKAIVPLATKVIFNSISQLRRFLPLVGNIPVGLRVNPGVSHSDFDLADPARRYCRLGATEIQDIMSVSDSLSGVMFHCNCENADLNKFSAILDHIAQRFEGLLKKLDWVSLGGGIYFTKEGYPLNQLAQKLADFSEKFDVQVYLEPGETAITQSGFLVTRVLDVVHNEVDIAVVDAAVETHMLDLLIYRSEAKLAIQNSTGFPYMIAGRTCLAGDIFGSYYFPEKLEVGALVSFADAAGYTMVKKNWFNGIPMPSIVVRRLDGRFDVVRQFNYDDYVRSLS